MQSRYVSRVGIGCLLLLVVVPLSTSAAVTITEVAWMGSASSANHEWIELYNDGAVIDVDGWKLTDLNNLEIDISGQIPAESYVVIERTSDDSAPGIALMTYTGALTNTGATLVLYDDTMVEVDRVVGGDAWETIGGDNELKHTPQRTASGWVTAAPTPGSAPAVTPDSNVSDTESVDESSGADPATVADGTASEPLVLTLPGVTLQLDISARDAVQTNQSLDFLVTSTGVGDTIANSLRYQWNFGDGTTAAGQEVSHQYSRPGQYVVTVHGAYKRQHQLARHTVMVHQPTLELTRVYGGVAIEHVGVSELQLDRYTLSAERSVTLPEYSIVMPGASVVISTARLGDTADTTVVLRDSAGEVAAMLLPGMMTSAVTDGGNSAPVTTPAPQVLGETVVRQNVTPTQPLVPVSVPSVPDNEPVVRAAQVTPAPPQSENETETDPNPTPWPLYGLVGLLGAGIVALYVVPRGNAASPPDWW